MENEKMRKRLLRILDMVPALKETLLSGISLEAKRKEINEYLSNMLIATFDEDPAIPPLEWVLTRDAIMA
jgi:lysine 2,3-aminomutase